MEFLLSNESGAHLCFESFNFSILVLQLSPKLICCYLLSLHNLYQVDVFLHQDLTFNDDVRVTVGELSHRVTHRKRGSNHSAVFFRPITDSTQLSIPAGAPGYALPLHCHVGAKTT